MRVLKTDGRRPYRALIGVGGIGTGSFFALEGNQTLGRNESRPGRLLDVRDYCKLQIVTHYIAKLLGAGEKTFPVLPIGRVGNDASGERLRQEMQAAGMDTRFVTVVAAKPTLSSVCFQYPDGSGGNITTSNSAAADIRNQDVDDALRQVTIGGKQIIALVVPEVPLSVRQHLISCAHREGALCAASFVSAEIAQAKQWGIFDELDLVALNEAEVAEFLGLEPASTEKFVDACLAVLRDFYPNLRLVVTVGKRGAYGFENGNWNFCPAPEVQISSTAGAGDALLAGVISALAAGVGFIGPRRGQSETTISTALEFGVLLASYSVTSPHTIHPEACLDALAQFAKDIGRTFSSEFLERFAEL